jgi:hypothetical protein
MKKGRATGKTPSVYRRRHLIAGKDVKQKHKEKRLKKSIV